MDVTTAYWLTTPAGLDACRDAGVLLAAGTKPHGAIEKLRRTLDPVCAAAAWENALLRERAVGRFPMPDSMLFVREALEQATSRPVAKYRAQRYSGFAAVLDWGAGIGGDSLALAEQTKVVAVDRDGARAILHRHNMSVTGVADRVLTVRGDGRLVHPNMAPAAFVDPDRRVMGRRTLEPALGSPSLDEVLARAPLHAGIKLAPAADAAAWEKSGQSLEWISCSGELKEQVLWRGDLSRPLRQAAVLPAGAVLAGDPQELAPEGYPEGYLLDPDPAVTCAGLAPVLAQITGSALLPEGGGFLVSRSPVSSPFACCLEIIAEFPLRPERLKTELKALNAGPVEFRKRHSAIDAEALRLRVKTRGDVPLIVALTRHEGRDHGLICRRIESIPTMAKPVDLP
jgi:hypothetical protein